MARMRRHGRLLLLALIVVLFARPAPAAARSLDSACPTGPDTFSVLFLVDQSDSMGGTTIARTPVPASDPRAQRRYAPTFALYRLGEERFLVPWHPADALGVVEFGHQPSVALPLTAIAPDWRDLAGWDAQRADLAAGFAAKSRGDTDFRQAFAAAAEQFAQQERACGADVGQKAIVLVTDGVPCVVASGCDPAASFWPSDQTYLRQLIDEVEKTFDRRSYRLWVLALSPPGSAGLARTLPEWQELARWYDGSVVSLAGTTVATATRVNQILEQLGLRSRWSLCSTPGAVEPSLAQLSLWLVKLANGAPTAIELPDGTTLRTDDPRVALHLETATDEELVVSSPPPGQWRWSGCADLASFADRSTPTVAPAEPTATPIVTPSTTSVVATLTPTPSPAVTPVGPTATPPATATGTPVPPPTVPPTRTPTPTPPRPSPPIFLIGMLGALVAAAIGILAYILYNRQGPRGRLVFVGVADRDERGTLDLVGWPHQVRLGAEECARYLPAIGLTSLTAQAGPSVNGRTTVKLLLIGQDGHVVNHHFRDNEADFVNDRNDCEVVYEAISVFQQAGRRVREA